MSRPRQGRLLVHQRFRCCGGGHTASARTGPSVLLMALSGKSSKCSGFGIAASCGPDHEAAIFSHASLAKLWQRPQILCSGSCLSLSMPVRAIVWEQSVPLANELSAASDLSPLDPALAKARRVLRAGPEQSVKRLTFHLRREQCLRVEAFSAQRGHFFGIRHPTARARLPRFPPVSVRIVPSFSTVLAG